ncbi:MAG: carboxypeptidase regulatory-like domain-containing protein, partial [Opitutaceae bacterium]
MSNAVSGSPLGRAKVVIRGTAQETLTDDDGRFFLRGAPAREIELEVSYLGFTSQTTRLTVPPGGQVARDFQLRRGAADRRGAEDQPVMLDTFQVVAEQTMSGQAVAMNEQRHAATIQNV